MAAILEAAEKFEVAARGNEYVGGNSTSSTWGNLGILRDRAGNPLRRCRLFVVDR
jgi:hypothetical protein